MNKYTAILLSLIFTSFLYAQDEAVEEAEKDSLYFIFEPEELTIEVGDSARVRITLVNQNVKNVENPLVGGYNNEPKTSIRKFYNPRMFYLSSRRNIFMFCF